MRSFLCGRSLRWLLVLLALTSTVSCSNPALKLLTGGGPNVAANVQAGKTNSQTVGVTRNIAPTATVRPHARVDTIDQSMETNNKYELPILVYVVFVVLFIIGWVTDTPLTMIRRKNPRR